jgi:hypothetical protein
MTLWISLDPEIGLVCAKRNPEKSFTRSQICGSFFGPGFVGFVDRVEVRTLEHSWRFSELGL